MEKHMEKSLDATSIFIAVECTDLNYDSKQLKSVILVHRHGDRSPVSTYTGDPNEGYWYKYGVTTLTQ
ncbi:hypothetical protein B4U80_13913, partial [Leptotrombidium deliense]